MKLGLHQEIYDEASKVGLKIDLPLISYGY
jgi:hypothetical protein